MNDFAKGSDQQDVARFDYQAGAQPDWDKTTAVFLHVVMALIAGYFFIFGAMNVAVHACPQDPACNQPLMNLSSQMLFWPVGILFVSVIFTVVQWRRKRRVFWVPILALVLDALVITASIVLRNWAW